MPGDDDDNNTMQHVTRCHGSWAFCAIGTSIAQVIRAYVAFLLPELAEVDRGPNLGRLWPNYSQIIIASYRPACCAHGCMQPLQVGGYSQLLSNRAPRRGEGWNCSGCVFRHTTHLPSPLSPRPFPPLHLLHCFSSQLPRHSAKNELFISNNLTSCPSLFCAVWR